MQGIRAQVAVAHALSGRVGVAWRCVSMVIVMPQPCACGHCRTAALCTHGRCRIAVIGMHRKSEKKEKERKKTGGAPVA